MFLSSSIFLPADRKSVNACLRSSPRLNCWSDKSARHLSKNRVESERGREKTMKNNKFMGKVFGLMKFSEMKDFWWGQSKVKSQMEV